MFLRAYRRADKRRLQQLFFETVHTVNARHYAPEQLDAWAPFEPDRDAWVDFDLHDCFVVEDRKSIVGFASINGAGALEFLYVHKNAEGKGIGTALLKQVERLARKKGFPSLHAEVNVTARMFFEKNGFVVQQEILKTVRGAIIPLVKMAKPLPLPML